VSAVVFLVGAVAGALALAWLTQYLADPQRAREDAEDRLSKQEPVTLIGETGPPRYFQWALGEETSLASTAPDRPFFVLTTKLALIEFPYAARLRRYRVRAEVGHHQGVGITATAGIYFLRKAYDNLGEGNRFSFLTLSFADHGPVVRRQGKPESQVGLQAYYLEPRPNHHYFLVTHEVATSRPYHPPPGVFQLPEWRELLVEVSPREARASWVRPDGQREVIGAVTPGSLSNHVARQKRLPVAELRNLSLEFDHQSGFGLFVDQGAASFRRVVVEPLADNP
jgi:serine/threonine-protein kinase